MDVAQLNEDLLNLVEKKQELSGLTYNDPEYDDVEEELHDREDDFVENYGDYLEDALHSVHDEYCPDDDVLLPTAYLANEYIFSEVDGQLKVDVPAKEGVMVMCDDFPGKVCRLVLLPNPTRIVLKIGTNEENVAWEAK